jgi:BirA family biotin operon repressor/biotin-[acetyl-CoA-carboxylase] ligase
LAEETDRWSADDLAALLQTRELGRQVLFLPETTSTSEVAFDLALKGAPSGQVVIADSQTKGKGRLGRSWASPPGSNLYLSVVVRPDLPTVRAAELTLVSAVALAETLIDIGCKARIKWPNDVEIEAKKVAGILTELTAEGDRVSFVILGMGVNLNMATRDFPVELRDRATSVSLATGGRVSRASFCASLLERLEQWLDRHEDGGFAPVRARWTGLASTPGSRVRVTLGGREVIGDALEIDSNGALLVRSDSGKIERVLVGDVEVLRRQG